MLRSRHSIRLKVGHSVLFNCSTVVAEMQRLNNRISIEISSELKAFAFVLLRFNLVFITLILNIKLL